MFSTVPPVLFCAQTICVYSHQQLIYRERKVKIQNELRKKEKKSLIDHEESRNLLFDQLKHTSSPTELGRRSFGVVPFFLYREGGSTPKDLEKSN